MTLRFTILGCGSSAGAPRLGAGGADWGACDPSEPRNRRTRCSLLAERTSSGNRGEGRPTRILVDTSPDLREQLLAAKVDSLDAVLLSHDHADQTHGIDDLRPLTYLRPGVHTPVYMDAPTARTMRSRFGYIFETPAGNAYPPICEARAMPAPGTELTIEGPGGAISVTPLAQDHGRGMASLGFRFGALAYSNDVQDLPPETMAALYGVRVWIVDALRYAPHPTHAHLEKALGWIAMLKPGLAVLTNLHVDMDYRTLRRELPPGVIPAHDGMAVLMDGADFRIAE